MNTNLTFIAIKPDGVQKGLIGEIIGRLERLGYQIRGLKMTQLPAAVAEEHYKEHKDKPFFSDLVSYICASPIVTMVVEGENIVEIVRKIVGATDPVKAATGTIRGDYATSIAANIIHASDSPESAAREIQLFFPEIG